MSRPVSVRKLRSRAWGRAVAGGVCFVAACALLVGGLVWSSGATQGGYSSPQAVAKAYVEASIAGDPEGLCRVLAPADREVAAHTFAREVEGLSPEERRALKIRGTGCVDAMRLLLVRQLRDREGVSPGELAYTVEAREGDGVARVLVTRGVNTFDTVATKREGKRWYLDLDALSGRG
ncbi:MAG: hypothetical protein Q4B10_03810 [Actinomycetaceae bacterium]|nr:hypothetical protein [Actinomycetaceae bacterium]